MHVRYRLAAFILALAALVVASPATVSAISFTTFSDQASFLAAAGPGLAFEDFEGILQGATVRFFPTLSSTTNDPPFVSPGDIPPGVVFSAPGGVDSAAVLSAGFFGPRPVSDSLLASTSSAILAAAFSPGVTAVGSDLFNDISTGMAIAVMDGSGGLQTFTLPSFTSAYFGIIASGGGITQIQWLSTSGRFGGIDNIHFGQVAVPEPSSLLLLGSGLAGLAGWRWRKP